MPPFLLLGGGLVKMLLTADHADSAGGIGKGKRRGSGGGWGIGGWGLGSGSARGRHGRTARPGESRLVPYPVSGLSAVSGRLWSRQQPRGEPECIERCGGWSPSGFGVRFAPRESEGVRHHFPHGVSPASLLASWPPRMAALRRMDCQRGNGARHRRGFSLVTRLPPSLRRRGAGHSSFVIRH